MSDRYGMTKIHEDEYKRLMAIETAFETLTEGCYGEGPFTITIEFENDNDEHYDHLWVEAHITPKGDPLTYLAEYIGEATSIEETIISMVKTLQK